MAKKTLKQRVEALEKRLRNAGCNRCRWYRGNSMFPRMDCRNKKHRVYRSGGAFGDYFVEGGAWKINGDRDCPEFKKKRWWGFPNG